MCRLSHADTIYTQADAYEAFIGSAKRLSKEPIAILDLRGNGGGDAGVVQRWLNAYDPNGIAKNIYGTGCFFLSTKAASYLVARSLQDYSLPGRSQDMLYNEYMLRYHYDANSCYLIKDDAKLTWNDGNGLLFVLMDSHTISGGEWLLAALRTRSNVVFVGENSAGMMLGASGQKIALPNSKIKFQFGTSLLLGYDERVFQEGRGFLPDLWVGGDALERVRALIGYYDLG